MAQIFAFDIGSLREVLKVDDEGRLMVNSDANAAKFVYEIGPFSRFIFVDADGALIIRKT